MTTPEQREALFLEAEFLEKDATKGPWTDDALAAVRWSDTAAP